MPIVAKILPRVHLDTATGARMVPIRSMFIGPEAVPSRHRFPSPTPLRAGTARAPAVAVWKCATPREQPEVLWV